MATFTEVNPYNVRPGDHIQTKSGKSREIKRVESCPSVPEQVHLDHECYDSRFTTVMLKN